ncbi:MULTISPECIES: hypothetical protein [Enterobacterales]|uniref:hypothetical protein n=1 Tax=Enterobacterales TaxID=91347 RepID=UPI001E3528E6|nr:MULTISPECIES: hypothetical protein [Enterobacterales]MDI0464890.1 hypothetical protein [Klebsiella variicola]MDP8626304.1 hypothetical protein [Serratia marcescens]MDP8675738.1 hypothetical protein [Serratia marcescens]MDP8690741.1 hypothetical protein [Serratia marcescens]MDP8699996.1 hypothetical protein [Serratia marcescens]
MTQEIISPIEKQQILDETNKWLDSIYPYKRPAAELCDHINRDSDFFRIDAHRKNFVFIFDLVKHGYHLEKNQL